MPNLLALPSVLVQDIVTSLALPVTMSFTDSQPSELLRDAIGTLVAVRQTCTALRHEVDVVTSAIRARDSQARCLAMKLQQRTDKSPSGRLRRLVTVVSTPEKHALAVLHLIEAFQSRASVCIAWDHFGPNTVPDDNWDIFAALRTCFVFRGMIEQTADGFTLPRINDPGNEHAAITLPGRTLLHPRRMLSAAHFFGLLGRLLALAVADGRLLDHGLSDEVCQFLFSAVRPPDASRSHALNAMRKGFQHGLNKLAPGTPALLLLLFAPEERPMLLRGRPIPAAAVAAALQFATPPYVTLSHHAAKVRTWLRDFVRSLDEQRLARFVRFVTNAPCALSWVAVGAGDGVPVICVQILASLPSSRLPYAMVRQRVLQCPFYENKSTLVEKMQIAMEEGSMEAPTMEEGSMVAPMAPLLGPIAAPHTHTLSLSAIQEE